MRYILLSIFLLVPLFAYSKQEWESVISSYRPYTLPSKNSLPKIPKGSTLIVTNALYAHEKPDHVDPYLVNKYTSIVITLLSKGDMAPKGRLLLKEANDFKSFVNLSTSLQLKGLSENVQEKMQILGEHMLLMTNYSPFYQNIDVFSFNTNEFQTLKNQTFYLFGLLQAANKLFIDVNIRTSNSKIESRKFNAYNYKWRVTNKNQDDINKIRSTSYKNLINAPPPKITEAFSSYVSNLSKMDLTELAIALQKLCIQNILLGGESHLCNPFKEMAAKNINSIIEWLSEIQYNRDRFKHEANYFLRNSITNIGEKIIYEFIKSNEKAINFKLFQTTIITRFTEKHALVASLLAISNKTIDGYDDKQQIAWDDWKKVNLSYNLIWQLIKINDEYKIRMIINEQPVFFPIENCQDKHFCDWEIVKSHYKDKFETSQKHRANKY